MSTSHSKCPVCGAEITFNPDLGIMKCEYCEAEFKPEDLFIDEKPAEKEPTLDNKVDEDKKVSSHETEETVSTDETEGNLVAYKCSFCGAEVVTAEDTAATFCVYCHRPLIIDEQLSNEFKPQFLIPFETTKEDAIEIFKKYTKQKKLIPNNFKDDVVIQKIMGVYIPFWLLDCLIVGNIKGTGEQIKRWSSSDYNYKKVDTYEIERHGRMEFNNIPADASKKIDDAIMDSIEPFDYSKMIPYNKGYLTGFLAQRYDVNTKEITQRIGTRAATTFREKLRLTCNYNGPITILNEDFHLEDTNYKYALLPVWLLYTEYNGEFYPFAMNGQTGKFIGNVPMDKKKMIIHGAAAATLGFLLSLIFTFLGGV